MKILFISIFILLPTLLYTVNGQNIAINTDGSLPDASAVLDITSTGKGFLAPRMTTTQQNLILLPAKGLLIYNITDNLFRVNTGTAVAPIWTALSTATNNWLLTGNSATNAATNFLGTTDNVNMSFRTNNLQRMVIDAQGRTGIGVTNPTNPLVVKDTLEIRRVGAVSQLLFSNTAGSGDFRIAGDGGDIFWQGGGTRNLQMGSFWGISLAGDRQNATLPGFAGGVANTNVLIQAQRDASVPLALQSGSVNQTANLTEWRNASGTILDFVDKNGNASIGGVALNSANPEKLLVDAGVTNSVNSIAGKGNINNYLQLNIQNTSSGTNASSDVVATANNGDESNNYVDMGINGGGNTSGIMGTANDAYLYNIGENFLIGTGASGKSLLFLTGGTDSASNERMRIDGVGNVGIGVANPVYKLQVNAASNPLKLVGLQTGANTDSVLTVSNGVVRRLSPSALITSSTNAWGLTGNTATNPTTNFIGTTDAQALIIKENGVQVGRFDANSVALGNGATTNTSTRSFAIGNNATMGYGKTAAMALGNSAAINADSSFAIGTVAVSNAIHSFAIGNGATANSINSSAIGRNAFVAYSITDGIAMGTNATANSNNSIAIGSNTVIANKTTANAASSIAVGSGAASNSPNSISIGANAKTGYSLTNPIAIGYGALVNGTNGVSIGNSANVASVSNATIIGALTSATSTANNSTAIGYNTDITLPNEIILGDMSNNLLSVGIGTENFSSTNREKFLVDAGVTTSVNSIVGKGSIDSYLQLNIQNNSAGTSASSDVVATANNGSETNNYVDMGINGSAYSGGVMGDANDSYLYNMGQDFLIATGSASKSLVFMTGGTSQSANERMRIDGTGNVGIGTNAPSQKLDITGNLLLNGAFMPNNNAGSTGFLLQSNGSGVAPSWINAASYLSSLTWTQGGTSVSSTSSFGTTSNHDLPFITNNTERMRLTASGNVGIGVTNPVEKLVVQGNIVPATTGTSTLGTSAYKWNYVWATNGTIQTSDKRLKTDINNLNYGLKEVLAMRPVSFYWKTTPRTNKKVGLIAQEVKLIIPEVVTGDEAKESLGLNYAELIPVLINAVKEQQKQISDLKNIVEKLQAEKK